jgi:hypothetical protein
VAARSKALFCGRSLAEIAGSNTAGSVDFSFSWTLCVVRCGSLRRPDLSSTGVLLGRFILDKEVDLFKLESKNTVDT